MAATTAYVLLTVLFSACYLRLVSSQLEFLGPDLCLVSRTEIIPCNFRGDSVPVGENQVGEFRTRFLPDTNPPECRIVRSSANVQNASVVGIANQVYNIHSPGIELVPPNQYENDRYVVYNISCGEGRIVFFNITNMSSEGKTCPNPNLSNSAEVCVDYLRVDRGPGGFTESCGNDAGSNKEQIEEGSFQAIWRTSMSGRFDGFEGYVVCFDPDEADLAECTEADGQERRKKRHINYSSPLWNRHLSRVRRMKRRRYNSVTVPYGVSLTYSNKLIEFTDDRDNLTAINGLPTLESICFLKEFDGINNPRLFAKSARDWKTGELIRLPGPGILFYKYGFAYFQRFFINPRGILPTEAEREILFSLSQAIRDIFQVLNMNFTSPTIIVPTSPIEPQLEEKLKPYLPYQPSFPMQKRQVDLGLISLGNAFEDDTILLAIQHENACNPVLRASANSILESADPERLSLLRSLQP